MLTETIEKVLDSSDGNWGVYAKDLSSSKEYFSYHENLEFPAASIAKLPIALYIFHQVSSENMSFDEIIPLDSACKLGGSGILEHLHSGLNLTLLDTVKLMLMVSDNTAAKLLVKKCTPQKINEYLKRLGFTTTKLEIEGDKFWYGDTTPKEIAGMLESLYSGNYFNLKLSKTLLEIMKHNHSDLGIRRHLPHDIQGEKDKKLEVSNKEGSLPGVRNDVGIVFGKRPYVISILSKNLSDKSYKPDNEGLLTIARVSKLIYELASSA